jgi:hypothetical protein
MVAIGQISAEIGVLTRQYSEYQGFAGFNKLRFLSLILRFEKDPNPELVIITKKLKRPRVYAIHTYYCKWE